MDWVAICELWKYEENTSVWLNVNFWPLVLEEAKGWKVHHFGARLKANEKGFPMKPIESTLFSDYQYAKHCSPLYQNKCVYELSKKSCLNANE